MLLIALWLTCILISFVGSIGEPSNTKFLAIMMGIFLPPLGAIAGIGQLVQNIRESNMTCIWHDFEMESNSNDERIKRKLPISPVWVDKYKCKRCGTQRYDKGSVI